MCGICGAFHYRDGVPDAALVRRQVGVTFTPKADAV
jgi:hypothetical protein